MEEILTKLSQKYLDQLDFKSALFYADYFHSFEKSPFSFRLLAKCYVAEQNFLSAYLLLNDFIRDTLSEIGHSNNSDNDNLAVFSLTDCPNDFVKISSNKRKFVTTEKSEKNEPKFEYKKKTKKFAPDQSQNLKDILFYFAFSCLKLNKIPEAISVLNTAEKTKIFGCFSSREFQIFGELYSQIFDHETAEIYYKKAFEKDPMSWSLIKQLCKLRNSPTIPPSKRSQIFKQISLLSSKSHHSKFNQKENNFSPSKSFEISPDILKNQYLNKNDQNFNKNGKNDQKFEFKGENKQKPRQKFQSILPSKFNGYLKKFLNQQNLFLSDKNNENSQNLDQNCQKITIFGEKTPKKFKINEKNENFDQNFDKNNEKNDKINENSENFAKKIFEIVEKAKNVLSHFYRSENEKAIKFLEEIPLKFSWRTKFLGHVFSGVNRFENAKTQFEIIRKMTPYHLDFLDVYSSVLWQLKNIKKLSSLSKELKEFSKLLDRPMPQFFVVWANEMSLLQKHANAISLLKQAIKFDKNYTYAYFLLGNEQLLADDSPSAMKNFREAIQLEPGNFKAWYGLGKAAKAKGDFVSAVEYFKKALQFNKNSSLIICNYSEIEAKLGHFKKALKSLNSIKEENFFAEFQKAKILFKIGSPKKALEICSNLINKDCETPSVYLLKAKIYRSFKEEKLALQAINEANLIGNCDYDLDDSAEL